MKKTSILTAMIALAMTSSTQAAMTAGQTIGFDFSAGATGTDGPDSVDGVNFTQVTGSGVTELDSSGSFMQYQVLAGGVWAGADGQHVTVAQAGYHDDYLNDFIVVTNEDPNLLDLVFSGLDTGLTYNVELLLGATNDTGIGSFTVVAAGQSGQMLTASDTENSIVSFTGLTASGSGMDGSLTLLLSAIGGDKIALSAGMITAIPEPGTYALIAGALALASVMVRRRR